MRRDGVAVGEGVEGAGEHPSIGQDDGPAGEALYLDALTVDELFAVVGLEQEPVTSGHFQLADLAHIKRRSGTAGDEINFGSVGTAHAQTGFENSEHFGGLAPVKMFGLSDEAQTLARLVLAGIFLLRFCPRERIEYGDSFLVLAKHAVSFQR